MSASRSIVHIDGDAFFASVEQAKDYRLKGRPIVTGSERGIAASMSYEAKARGVTRGMRISDIKKVCPEAVVVPSDYEMYCIYARRMYNIVRRYTDQVEEYSIDECFADITDSSRLDGQTYADIALQIKKDLETRLGITFGVGLAPNKVLAKAASKHRKPAGFTVIQTEDIDSCIKNIPIHKVWGIGGSMSMYLRQRGIESAHDFTQKNESWLRTHQIAKPYKEIWYELQGYFVKPLVHTSHHDIGSIMRSRTFTPPTSDKSYILSQLSKNIEAACEQARHHTVQAGSITFFLKTQEFRYKTKELDLPIPTSVPTEIISAVRQYIDEIYDPRLVYRTTGITLRNLIQDTSITHDLFGRSEQNAKRQGIFSVIDGLNKMYGSNTILLGSTLNALHREKHQKGARSRRLNIPFVGIAR